MTTRIYIVTSAENAKLVRAANPAQALRHVARGTFTTKVATQDDIVTVVSAGGKVEDATKDDDTE